MNNKEKFIIIVKRLKKEYPKPKTALSFKSPFELLVATILSAQATDAHVNKVTDSLFKKYKSVKDYKNVSPEVFQKDVSSINFYKTKAKNIQAAAKMIVEHFNSKVPKTMDELTSLPGVARKTANIILSNVYGIHEGIAVDTHVKRLSYRLGLTKHEDPVKIEKDLMEIVPKSQWKRITPLLIFQGRNVCIARKPKCSICVLNTLCHSAYKV